MADGLYTFGTLETVEIPYAGPQYANDAVQKAPLGVLYRHKGNVYRYVLCDGSDVDIVTGAVVYWETLSPTTGVFLVTADYDDGIAAGVNMVAGVQSNPTLNPITGLPQRNVDDGHYTWIQVGGVCYAQTAAGTVAGDGCSYGVDATFARMAAGSFINQCFAIALGARNGTTGLQQVLLQNLIW
jgi:hypothetical protein